MINELLKRSSMIIVIAFMIFIVGCKFKTTYSNPKPEIKHVLVDSDLSKALGVNLVKYEFNLQGLNIPQGKLPFITTWVELYQNDKIIQQWSTPHEVIEETGSILFSFYEPPLFVNDQGTVKARVIGQSRMDISPDMPFKRFGHELGFSEKTIELDTDYTLVKVMEPYSPLAKTRGISPLNINSAQDKSENKALILKVKFELIEE